MPRSTYVNWGVFPIDTCPRVLNATLLNVLFTIGNRVPTRKVAASPSMALSVMASRLVAMEWFMASLALIGETVTPVKPLPLPKKIKGASSGDPARVDRAEDEILLGS